MITTTTTPNRKGRRLMKMAGGAVVLGVLATTGCAPSERTTASPAPAQPTASLAPGDTSRGADNFYTSDRVTVQKVTFKNQYQMNVTGNLFVPNDLDRNTKNAAMVVGHPMGAVKEQSANLYATKLAERGFVTLSLDLSYWGESEGQPRNLVAPDVYTEDFSAAVDYLRTQSFVDTERIGALGVCGSGSFVISAAKIDPRIKAVATVSMYDMGGVNRNGLRGAMTPEMRQEALALAAQQRDVEFTGGDVKYIGGTPFELDDQSTAIDREFYDFYRTARGNSPDTTTQPTLSSNVRFMNFYPFEDIETISPRPMLFITGDQAHSREFSEQAYQLAAEPKQLVTFPAPATSTSTTAPTSSPSTPWPPSSRPTWTPANDR